MFNSNSFVKINKLANNWYSCHGSDTWNLLCPTRIFNIVIRTMCPTLSFAFIVVMQFPSFCILDQISRKAEENSKFTLKFVDFVAAGTTFKEIRWYKGSQSNSIIYFEELLMEANLSISMTTVQVTAVHQIKNPWTHRLTIFTLRKLLMEANLSISMTTV